MNDKTTNMTCGHLAKPRTAILIGLALALLLPLVYSPDQAFAQTQEEAGVCHTKYNGKKYFTSSSSELLGLTQGVTGVGSYADFVKFANSKCVSENGGNCTLKPLATADTVQVSCTKQPVNPTDEAAGGDGEEGTSASSTGGGYKDTGAKSCAGVSTSIIGCSSTKGESAFNSLLKLFINFLSAGVAIAVVGGIVVGGIMYSQANGNSSKAQQGVTFIVNAVIGLLVFIFMYAIINFIIPGGLLS